ncbi:hypothetical protein EVAR_44432_1 [Eumeta japonica]|uniref:Uncharacterized protein n=1 Tax=Eumeta variegata TaxID=151549 RepID=A0A4C1XRQ8_EUMVA|nr:hypothetical protein EVAR_44432_1 [Eumeta japonica]
MPRYLKAKSVQCRWFRLERPRRTVADEPKVESKAAPIPWIPRSDSDSVTMEPPRENTLSNKKKWELTLSRTRPCILQVAERPTPLKRTPQDASPNTRVKPGRLSRREIGLQMDPSPPKELSPTWTRWGSIPDEKTPGHEARVSPPSRTCDQKLKVAEDPQTNCPHATASDRGQILRYRPLRFNWSKFNLSNWSPSEG